jgi:hypothetical protein
MSYNFIGYSSSLHVKGEVYNPTQGSHLTYSIQPRILWEHRYLEAAIKLITYAERLHISYHQFDTIIPMFFEHKLHSAVYEFSLALAAYDDSPYKGPMNSREIFLGCFQGPAYADFLKKTRTASFMKAIDGSFLVTNKKLLDIKALPMEDIGSTFNYKYLINWQEPESQDLNEYSFTTLPWDYDEEDLEEFAWHVRYELSQIPLQKVKVIPKQEVLLRTSTSTTMRGIPLVVEKQMSPAVNYMASQLGDMKHFSLQKGPTESRDIVLLQPAESNLVRWVDNQVLEIVSNHKWSVHTKDPFTFSKKFKGLSRSNYFYCRDIEKEGLTKPHKLLKILLQELYDYSKMECFSNDNMFEYISVDGRRLSRGHGLGMANALTTLMQIGIHSLNISKLEKEKKAEVKHRAGFLNDDAAVGFYDADDRERFIEIDFETCENLKVCGKDSKSFKSNFGFVLCEEYYKRGSEINRKDSYWRYVALKPLNAVNVTHAKDIAGSINPPGNYLDYYKPYYLEKWGYEFTPLEGNLPSIFGGWGSYTLGSSSFDLYVAEKEDINYKVLYKLFKACRVTPTIPKWLKAKAVRQFVKKASGTIIQFYPVAESIGFPPLTREEAKLIGVPGTIYDIASEAIQWRKEPEAYRSVWENLYKQRQKAYKRALCTLNYEESFILYKNELSSLDHFIPEGLTQGYEDIIEPCVANNNIYDTEFTELNKIAVAKNVIIGFLYPNRLAINRYPKRYIPPDPMKSEAWLIDSFTGSYWIPEKVIEFATGEKSNKYYINPGNLVSMARNLGVIKGKLPINLDWDHPLLNDKESVFGRALDIDEEALIHTLEPMEKEMIKQVTYQQEVDSETLEEFKEMLEDILYEPIEIPPEPEPPPEDEEAINDPDFDEFVKRASNEIYETVVNRFTWSTGVNYGAWTESGGVTNISTLGYNPQWVIIPEIRKAVEELTSRDAYRSWIKSTGELGKAFLEDSDTGESEYGFDLDQLGE